jgi:DNA-directed RNA polymerase specialized sigma24 family protein
MARFSPERGTLWPQNDTARAWEAPRAFEEWVLTYQTELFSFVCGAIGDQNDEADGIAVEAFAQVHALAYQGRIEDTPVAELYRIAIRESARRLSIRPRTHGDGRRQMVWRILMGLDENERLLLLLREAAGYSVPQIATCLRLSEEQVRCELLAARQSFAALLRLDDKALTERRRSA